MKLCVFNMFLKLLYGFIYKYIVGLFYFFLGKYGNGENVKYYLMLKFDLIFVFDFFYYFIFCRVIFC